MANRRNNRKSRRNEKRRINKKKLTLLFIVVILFIAGAFKLTQGAISTIKNTSNNKKQTSVVESSNNEYENLPTEVDKNINKKYTILIDPGHGGNDKGTIANDKITCEKDITLKVGALVAQKLTKQKDVQVIISRNEDKYVSLADRAKLANEQGVDALVSIHLNGQTGGTDVIWT